jgi:protocatechuate 4,5-dioxygenase beta chain
MPLVMGCAVSYSPLLYRPRGQWSDVHEELVGNIPQPQAFQLETAPVLDAYEERIERAFGALARRFERAQPAAIVTLTADHGTMFDVTNVPQLHVFAGDAISGGDVRIPCLRSLGETIAEELAFAGFDVSESRGDVHPAKGLSAGAALIDAIGRIAPPGIPIVPIHVNCHVAPEIAGKRMHGFGTALAAALELVPERVAVLVSGGLSGDPGGPLAGWVDDVLDQWVLGRLTTRRSADIGRIFEVDSMTLHGSTREIRLWSAAGGAMESVGATPHVVDYLPFHHAAAGVGFMHWER